MVVFVFGEEIAAVGLELGEAASVVLTETEVVSAASLDATGLDID